MVEARVRMKDVAALAGVSAKTVSNVVNDSGSFSDLTRQRVLAALDELGYRLHHSARNLRRGRTGLITLAVPELDVAYFAETARSVVHAAKLRDLTVLVDQTEARRERELAVIHGLRQGLVDGAILNPLQVSEYDLRERGTNTPLVLIGEGLPDVAIDQVAIDNVAAARAMTEHLLEIGRRRIAVIGATARPRTGTARMRVRGFKQALRAAGVAAYPDLLQRVPTYHQQSGAEAMRRLVRVADPPDAVFCFNDLLAFGALRELADGGVRVPDDIAVAGFDDVADSQFSIPRLTTVAPNKTFIAETAVSLLAQQLENPHGREPVSVTARFELRIRESTAGAARS